MHPLETYIRELRDIRASGAAVAETSYYGPLATLLNEVGKTLKPRVRCIINLRNQGGGILMAGYLPGTNSKRRPMWSRCPAFFHPVAPSRSKEQRTTPWQPPRAGRPLLGNLRTGTGNQLPGFHPHRPRRRGQPHRSGELPAGRQ